MDEVARAFPEEKLREIIHRDTLRLLGISTSRQ
jgi:hypothetical protein